MARKDDLSVTQVTLMIDEGTTVIVEGVEYSGTVTVNEDVADVLKSTGKVDNDATGNA